MPRLDGSTPPRGHPKIDPDGLLVHWGLLLSLPLFRFTSSSSPTKSVEGPHKKTLRMVFQLLYWFSNTTLNQIKYVCQKNVRKIDKKKLERSKIRHLCIRYCLYVYLLSAYGAAIILLQLGYRWVRI